MHLITHCSLFILPKVLFSKAGILLINYTSLEYKKHLHSYPAPIASLYEPNALSLCIVYDVACVGSLRSAAIGDCIQEGGGSYSEPGAHRHWENGRRRVSFSLNTGLSAVKSAIMKRNRKPELKGRGPDSCDNNTTVLSLSQNCRML